jgi:choice-of-anchor B domain-containing protein
LMSGKSIAQLNLTQLSNVTFPGQRVAGVWHYVDSSHHEYALVGTERGISIVDVTNPVLPVFILQVPGVTNKWKEIKTWGSVAYATTEGKDSSGINDGLQIIDLSFLPDSAPAHYWQGDGAIAGQLHKAHSVTVADGFVYVNGHDVPGLNGGVLIADLIDPINPHYVGAITSNYCHDSFVRGDTLWASEIHAGQFAVYRITDKANPALLATQPTPAAFNHNTWLSDNSLVLFTTDERNHAKLASYDVTDLSNIELLDKYSVINVVDPSRSDEVHNVRVLNDFLVNACYGSQITIVDAAHPDNLIEVGNFPIISSIAWDVDPFLPSGNILATGIAAGLFVLSPVYNRACYLEGNVADSLTGLPINDAVIKILSTVVKDSTNNAGVYKTGYLLSGNYSIEFSKPGYLSKVFSNVSLINGTITLLDANLVPDITGTVELGTFLNTSVFPNPFHEVAQMVIPHELFNHRQSINVILKDMTGREVKKITGINSSLIFISRENLADGLYFYEMTNDSVVVSKGLFFVVGS